RCPACGALERHRLQWLYLRRRTDLFARPNRVLHVAPEPCFRRLLETAGNIEYVTLDLSTSDVAVSADIMSLPFPDCSFDVVLCKHVVERVLDGVAGRREMFRGLKSGGWAILQVPVDPNREETLEDWSVQSPAARERL